ncbi:contractile injection system protein, VgrG/Pvc8 family [Marinomonas sp. THO17]|uniref:contractile injection system protein, VgrG/Pvc8 family n=1 Tax=Marinomonas sp. THO17 TaxID=3149048 RepID=UPI00336BC439
MSDNRLPLDYMAVDSKRQFLTNLSFEVKAGAKGHAFNANYLRLMSLQGQEAVSQSYHFSLNLRANEADPLTTKATPTSDFADLPPATPKVAQLPSVQGVADDLIGQWARVKIGYSLVFDPLDVDNTKLLTVAPDELEELPSRYFYGVISSISLSAPGEYTAEMQSPLFPLTLRNKYHLYKHMRIQEVFETLLQPELLRFGEQFKLAFHITGLAASRKQDWLQSGETDFAMLQRLMKKAAVYFYFVHGEDALTLVFSNQTSQPENVLIPGTKQGYLRLRYSYTSSLPLGLQQGDLLCNLQYQVTMVPNHLESTLVYREPNWRSNEVAGYDSYITATTEETDKVDYSYYKAFSYGVDEAESEESLSYLDSQFACQQSTLSGECTSTLLSPGYAFYLQQMPLDPSAKIPKQTATQLMPEQFNNAFFTVTKITHKASQTAPYSASIEATPIPFYMKKNTSVEVTQDKTVFDPNADMSVASMDGKAVLITPYDLQETHQGSVLAKVLESAVPKDAYFFEKANFDPRLGHVSIGEGEDLPAQRFKEIGCVVQFATDEGTSIKHWVALSDSSETVPAVNSMVIVARGDNESEIPQIQQALSSHGQKSIQPAYWKNNSWSFNTNWGSSCNTSYGDSLSIHFGEEVTPQLNTATKIVKEAYLNSSVLGANIGGASYNKGTSFSYSTTEQGAQGLASASVSQGSHFSESYSEQDYSVSYNNTRQSYSQSNKSVNISYQGPFVESIDENNLSFINGRIPNQKIIDICDGLSDGSNLSQSHTKGKSINLSGTGTEPPSVDSYDSTAVVYSHSKTEGKVINKNEQIGDTYSDSTTTGNTYSTSLMNGNTESRSTTMGNSTSNTQIIGNADHVSQTMGVTNQNDTFIGVRNNLSTSLGATNSMNTFVGMTNDISTRLSLANSINTMIGESHDVTTKLSLDNSINTSIGESNSISTNLSASNSISTNIGASNEVNNRLSLSNSINTTIGASNEVNTKLSVSNSTNTIIGASNDVTTKLSLGSSINTTIGASLALNTTIGGNMSVNTDIGGSVSVSTNIGANVSIDNNAGVKVQLSYGPAAITNQPSIESQIRGIVAEMLAVKCTL